MPILPTGKVPPKILEKTVFPFLGAADSDVIHGPGIGRDAALVRVERKVIVATTDPITGAVQNIGAYVIHICANDIATFGIRPRWFLATILLPENAESHMLEKIMVSMHSAAESLNVSIIGGHTEVTPELKRPIIIGFMLGVSDHNQYVASTQAKSGNSIILTKGVAIEGTAILATEREKLLRERLGTELVTRAQQYVHKISVVPEAIKAMETGAVTAMHDPTEGGVANGLHELADASELGFIVDRSKLVIHEETTRICDLFDINPLNLIGSGAMLIAVEEKNAPKVIQILKEEGISASIIGRLVKDPTQRKIIESDGSMKSLVQPTKDALWEALSKPL
ncbi:MAG: AIR synthase family protein [Promethearchaeota archaeon]